MFTLPGRGGVAPLLPPQAQGEVRSPSEKGRVHWDSESEDPE